MQEPKVMILVTCEDGHQVEMYPEKVIRVKRTERYEADAIEALWECPRCETPRRYKIDIA